VNIHYINAISLVAIGQAHQLPEKKEHFDSNCITPGTPFMAHLATCLRYHIAAKQNSDPLWKNVRHCKKKYKFEIRH
jgi:5'-3' exonuclease